jgi:hypothetical protein
VPVFLPIKEFLDEYKKALHGLVGCQYAFPAGFANMGIATTKEEMQ